MSYNISNWKTKRLENFIIPVSAFYLSERSDFHPEQKYDENTGEKILRFPLEVQIEGAIDQLDGGSFKVSKIDFYGEGSGYFYTFIFEPALLQSTGILEAVLIWEGGDSISRLQVENGTIRREEIEL